MTKHLSKTNKKLILYGLAAIALVLLIFFGRQYYYRDKLWLPSPESCAVRIGGYYTPSGKQFYELAITDQEDIDVLHAFCKSLRKTSESISYAAIPLGVNNNRYGFSIYDSRGDPDDKKTVRFSMAFEDEANPEGSEKLQMMVSRPNKPRDDSMSFPLYQATDENLYNAARAIIVRYHEEMLAAGPIPKE